MPQQEKVEMVVSRFTVKNLFHLAALMAEAVVGAATLFWLSIQALLPCLIFITHHIAALARDDKDMAR
jgi:fatty acid desaturase